MTTSTVPSHISKLRQKVPFEILKSEASKLGIESELVNSIKPETEIAFEFKPAKFTFEYKFETTSSTSIRHSGTYNCDDRDQVHTKSLMASITPERYRDQALKYLSTSKIKTKANESKHLAKEVFSCLEDCSDCYGKGSHVCYECDRNGQVERRVQEYVKTDVLYKNGRSEDVYEYRTRVIKETCGNCYGSQRITCRSCRGSGDQIYSVAVDFKVERHSQFFNFEGSFKDLTWMNDYLDDKKMVPVLSLADWDGALKDYDTEGHLIKETMTADVWATQQFVTVMGKLSKKPIRCIGGHLYDAGNSLSPHILKWMEQWGSGRALDPKKAAPLTNSYLFNALTGPNLEERHTTEKRLLKSGLISTDVVLSANSLFDKTVAKFKDDRDGRSMVWKTIVWTPVAFFFITLSLLIAGSFVAPGLQGTYSIIDIVRGAAFFFQGMFDRYDWQFHAAEKIQGVSFNMLQISIMTAVEMFLLGVGGSPWTARRVLLWFFATFPINAGLLVNTYEVLYSDRMYQVSKTLPLDSLAFLSILVGYMLARKGSWRKVRKQVANFESKSISAAMKYKEPSAKKPSKGLINRYDS